VPYPGGEVIALDNFQVPNEVAEKVKALFTTIQKKPSSEYCQHVELKDRFYLFKKNNQVEVCNRISPFAFQDVLYGKVELDCIYGGIVRKFSPAIASNIMICPDYKYRNMGKNAWWKKQKRIVPIMTKTKWPTGYPAGHFRLHEDDAEMLVDMVTT
jgi:hypothetical protein